MHHPLLFPSSSRTVLGGWGAAGGGFGTPAFGLGVPIDDKSDQLPKKPGKNSFYSRHLWFADDSHND